jgi:drug/metabolite transporter (DMT)-like permease
MILIILLHALFAASVWTSKFLLKYTTPIFLTGARMTLAGVILLATQYFYEHEHFHFKKKHFWLYIQIIFFGIYFNYILRFWGLLGMSASKSMFLFNLSPFITSLYSYLFLDERMTRRQWIGLTIGCVGIIPILLKTTPAEEKFGEFFFISLSEIAVIAAVAMHSYSWIVMRKLVRDQSCSPMMVNGITMSIGGALAFLTSLPVEGLAPINDVAPFISLLIFVVFISNIICHNLYGYLLRHYTPTLLSFAGFMGPIFAATYGRLFFGEVVTWHFYVSTVIVFIGLSIFYKDELSRRQLLA